MCKYVLTSNGRLYHFDINNSELYHYGVPGMKWGQRKARVAPSGGIARGKSKTTSQNSNPTAQKEARKAKAKKALKIGAAVAGTALAAYGAYKLSKFAADKARLKRAKAFDLAMARKNAAYNAEAQAHWDRIRKVTNSPGFKEYREYDSAGRLVGEFIKK